MIHFFFVRRAAVTPLRWCGGRRKNAADRAITECRPTSSGKAGLASRSGLAAS